MSRTARPRPPEQVYDEMLTGACVWCDCQASYTGDMPPGWVYLMTYWRKQRWDRPVMIFRPGSEDVEWYRNTVLCPEHNAVLEMLLGKPAGHS